jgi:hypothetical protein
MCLTIAAMSSLSGWLCWDDGCRMWLCIRHMLLKLSIKIYVYCVRCCVPWMAIRMAFSSALRMFCRPTSPPATRRLLAGQYIPDPVVLHVPFSSSGINGS